MMCIDGVKTNTRNTIVAVECTQTEKPDKSDRFSISGVILDAVQKTSR